MNTKTVQYKRTLRSSVGAGVSALFNGDGRRFFILNHKDNSKYHKAGESQKIIIDQIELGRDSNCQVRFDDESFKTVSRRHAAIVKDGERWKLVHLSATNSTLVNAVPVTTEKYLENGDEIQLSIGGPRMGFIVPAGKQSLVSSIKMTERLELFRKQALRPYKNAIACLAVLLVLGGSFGTYKILDLDEKNEHLQNVVIPAIVAEADSTRVANEKAMADMQKKYTVALSKIKPEISALIPKVEKDVCFIVVNYIGSINGQKFSLGSCSGTAFLLNDGKLVTARHCISERYNPSLAWNIEDIKSYGGQVEKEVVVYTPTGNTFTVSGDSFVMDEKYDIDVVYTKEIDGQKKSHKIKLAFPINNSKIEQALWGTDWTYVETDRKGSIVPNYNLSKNLKAGTTVHMLGYPKGIGFEDGNQRVEAIYHNMSVSRDGLNSANCIMVSSGADHGNSGGPVFALVGNRLEVVGIVSRGDSNSELYNHLIPLANIK